VRITAPSTGMSKYVVSTITAFILSQIGQAWASGVMEELARSDCKPILHCRNGYIRGGGTSSIEASP